MRAAAHPQISFPIQKKMGQKLTVKWRSKKERGSEKKSWKIRPSASRLLFEWPRGWRSNTCATSCIRDLGYDRITGLTGQKIRKRCSNSSACHKGNRAREEAKNEKREGQLMARSFPPPGRAIPPELRDVQQSGIQEEGNRELFRRYGRVGRAPTARPSKR